MPILERTPRRLRSDSPGERRAYLIAGSFVRYLIETFGVEKFRALYGMTPLAPRNRDPGDPDLWGGIYGEPLSELALEWGRGLRHDRSPAVDTRREGEPLPEPTPARRRD